MTVLSRRAVHVLGALMAALAPRMAQDAKLDLTPTLKGVTGKNFKTEKARIAADIKTATTGKLAKDANLDDVTQLLDALEKCDVAEGVDIDPTTGLPMEKLPSRGAYDGAVPAALLEFLKGKLSPEDMAQAEKLAAAPAQDETPEQKKKREDDEAAAKAAKEKDVKDMITKPAMDAAISAATEATAKKVTADVLAQAKATREAEKAVRPYVGELAVAQDSAEAVYRTALTALGVKVDGIHPSAFPALLAAQPMPNTKRAPTVLASDSSSAKSFAERYPDAQRIRMQ